jgi:glutathione S-transferase
MLTLRSSPSSPFVRKVRIAASVLGLDDQIRTERAETGDAKDTLRQQNPLGKIPALTLEDGTVLFDSRVILEYLDHRAGGGRIVPRDPESRFAALRLQALADGIMDASVLIIYEARWRTPERHEQKWLDHQAGKSRPRPCRAGGQAARARRYTRRRAHRAGLRAGPARFPFQWELAQGPPASGRVAR